MAKNKTSDLTTGVDIDPEDFAKEALAGQFDEEPDDRDDELEELAADAVEDADEEEDAEQDDPEEKDPAGDGEDDPEGTGSDPADGDDSDDEEETDDEEEDGEEPDPIVARARELGLGENFKTSDEVLQSYKSLKDRLSQRDEDAAFGRHVRDRGLNPEQLEALAGNGTQPEKDKKPNPKGWDPPVAFDPAWERTIKPKYDEDGELVGYDGPPDMVRKFQEYSAYEQNYWRDVMRNPAKLGEVLGPLVDERVQAETERIARERSKTEAHAQADAFMQKHKETIEAHGDEFFGLLERGMDPDLAIEHLQLKHTKKERPATGDEAKKKDLSKARTQRKERRAGTKVSPVRRRKPSRDKSEDEILSGALENLSEEDRAGLGL